MKVKLRSEAEIELYETGKLNKISEEKIEASIQLHRMIMEIGKND